MSQSNQSLYSITEELLAIQMMAEEEEFTPEMEERLVIAQAQLAVKAGGYAHVIKQLELQAAFAKSEIERIKAFADRKESAVSRLKKALLNAILQFGDVQRNGVRFIETDTFRISTRKAPAVVIHNIEQIPSNYYNTTVTIKGMHKDDADRFVQLVNNSKVVSPGTADNFTIESASARSEVSATKIKEANKAGTQVPGAKYDEERYGLAIK